MLGFPGWVGRAIGLDVHRDFCEVAIYENGKTRSAGRVPSTRRGSRRWPRVSWRPTASRSRSRAAAGRWRGSSSRTCNGWWWSVGMTLGSAVLGLRRTSWTRTLASLLWKGELEAVWMPDERCRILRRRLARREQLTRARTRVKNEIHATLQRRLQERPPCSDLFGVKGRQWLAGLELPLEERETVDAGIRQIEFLDAEIAAVDRLIAQQALSWPEIRRLVTVPGVNLICAATFIAAVGNANRFLTSRKLVAYLEEP